MKVSSALFQLKIIVNGKAVQEYHKDDKTFVEGRAGSEFVLQLTNLTPRRILVHPTVDGLSAMNGKEASRNDNSNGYVLTPFAVSIIPGWRLNNSEVAKFFFAGAGESYAEKQGSGENKGVIACAIWKESHDNLMFYLKEGIGVFNPASVRGMSVNCSNKPSPTSWDKSPPATECSTSGPIIHEESYRCGVTRERAQNLGTGFGDAAGHLVKETHFNPATSVPAATVVIFYDDLRGLKARGIKLSSAPKNQSLPNPFPGTRETGCTPPDDWQK